jgi:hypothetical protein
MTRNSQFFASYFSWWFNFRKSSRLNKYKGKRHPTAQLTYSYTGCYKANGFDAFGIEFVNKKLMAFRVKKFNCLIFNYRNRLTERFLVSYLFGMKLFRWRLDLTKMDFVLT